METVRLLVFGGLLLLWTTEVNSGRDLRRNNDDQIDQSEIDRQNRITKQIFANYLERHFFPYRRTNQRIPTIDEILPRSLSNKQQRPRSFHSRTSRRQIATSSPLESDDDISQDGGEVQDEEEKNFEEVNDSREADDESLQSVESEQFDQYYRELLERDPSENEIDSDCPNCVDETQYSNKWTMPLLKLGEKRYYLGIFFKANWFKATQYCRYHGMHLASIASQDENNRLEKYISDFGLGHEHFWTSGTDLADEGNFFWMANGRPITFTNWNAGEPNNFRYENGEEENCMELWNRDGKGLKWNDSPCSFETYFVCEVQPN
ncbi:low affinity immunoglobulin epsilon Fc receptor [Episyrphus balteatus]|uniref:low affinity immunoglobulin epsilon Fc receptor n=1 Tax=Episyrphus balteatus TaxID=286459 RepID=UPI0024858F1A|nr:low affinity immunoglobulin epsilon Fc receptor [Episyrphus balteatus]